MKIITVIVTYNRLELLKEAVKAVQQQTIKNEVIVVNNSSTDGTDLWLQNQVNIHSIHQENKGGSWGFYAGIKEAIHLNADWIWVLDDDTIPNADALQLLIEEIPKSNTKQQIGFLCSKVNWIDNTAHIMNLPHTKKGERHMINDNDAIAIVSCSFVSVLFSKEAVINCGLPYKEFFIWGDDIEFTRRITSHNFKGVYVPKSIAVHKTPENYAANIFSDNKKNIWKYRYDVRNRLFIVRKNKGQVKYFLKVFRNIFIMPVEILIKRKNNRYDFIKTVWKATIESFSFTPKVDGING